MTTEPFTHTLSDAITITRAMLSDVLRPWVMDSYIDDDDPDAIFDALRERAGGNVQLSVEDGSERFIAASPPAGWVVHCNDNGIRHAAMHTSTWSAETQATHCPCGMHTIIDVSDEATFVDMKARADAWLDAGLRGNPTPWGKLDGT